MMSTIAEVRRDFEVRVIQDGNRDCSTTSAYRADESGGWLWEASHACEAALVAAGNASSTNWDQKRILELGSGTGWLSLRAATLGANVVASDREGGLPRILRNVWRNQQRAFAADGEQALQVAVVALDWEQEQEQERAGGRAEEEEGCLAGRFDYVIGSDLIYNRDMHQPLLVTLCRRAHDAPCLLSWEERKPSEEADFLEMARARYGFSCTLVHETVSSVSGKPITVHCLRRCTNMVGYDSG